MTPTNPPPLSLSFLLLSPPPPLSFTPSVWSTWQSSVSSDDRPHTDSSVLLTVPQTTRSGRSPCLCLFAASVSMSWRQWWKMNVCVCVCVRKLLESLGLTDGLCSCRLYLCDKWQKTEGEHTAQGTVLSPTAPTTNSLRWRWMCQSHGMVIKVQHGSLFPLLKTFFFNLHKFKLSLRRHLCCKLTPSAWDIVPLEHNLKSHQSVRFC